MATKNTPNGTLMAQIAANEELKRINEDLKEKIKKLTNQVTKLKADNALKDEIIASTNQDLESAIKHSQKKTTQTLHQNKTKKTPKPKITNVSEEKKEDIIDKKTSKNQKSRGMIGIVGAGQMGIQLATLLSLKNYVIIIIDRQKPLLEKAKKINKSVCESYLQQKLITKQDINNCKIIYSESVNDISKYKESMNIIIDTAHDAYKKQVLQQIVKNINSDCMIISNSFRKCITELSSYIGGISPNLSKNLIGINLLYFELSLQNNKCIEIIPSWNTSHLIVNKCKLLVNNDLNKQCIILQDSCSFVSNRLYAVYINEAFNILQSKICSAEDIDKIQKLCMINQNNGNYNVAPFGLADKIGLNVIKDILDQLYKEYGEQKYVASSMLKQYIRCGKWGRKTGCGVYSYNQHKKKSDK